MKPPYLLDDHLPDQRLSDDENPPPVTYPQEAERITRSRGDFETAEIERLTLENETLRSLLPEVETVEEAHEIFTQWAAAYAAIDRIEANEQKLNLQLFAARAAYRTAFAKCPVHVREWLAELGSVLGV